MKIRVLTVISVLALSATALKAQVTFGIAAGPNFQNMTGKDSDGDRITNGLIVGFHTGVKANIPIATDFYFQTGLLYSQKGSNNDLGIMPTKSSSDNYNTTTRISYIDLPLHLLFRPAFGKGHILIGFGPYVGIGLGGRQTVDYESIPALEQKVKFQNEITSEEYWDMDHVYYRRFDAGADIFAGYELDMGLYFQLNTQLGFLNMMPDYEEWELPVLKNSGFGVTAGYNF